MNDYIFLTALSFGIIILGCTFNIIMHMGGGWNNKNIIPLADRILLSLDSGNYTIGNDAGWVGGSASCRGGSILTCYRNGQLKADGLILSFSHMFVRSTWFITDIDGRSYRTGYIQGLRLHRKIKEIYKKESKGHRIA